MAAIYSPETIKEQCQVAVAFKGGKPIIYSKDARANFVIGLKAYANMTDELYSQTHLYG